MSVDSETMRQLADLQQRLTRAEEQLAAGDPRVAEALETARQALSSAASAADLRKILDKLERELAAVSSRVPKSRGVGADDPPVPDPNEPQLPQSQNDPAPPGPPAATDPGSPSQVPPSGPQRRRRHFS